MATNKYVIIYVKHIPMGLLICKILENEVRQSSKQTQL